NDSDGGAPPLTLLSVTQPAHGAAAANANGTITYTPANGFNSFFGGADSFTYQIKNALGFTSSAKVTVTVTPLCTYTIAGDLSDDFESGGARWTVDTAVPAPGAAVNWQVVADPTTASPTNHAFFS